MGLTLRPQAERLSDLCRIAIRTLDVRIVVQGYDISWKIVGRRVLCEAMDMHVDAKYCLPHAYPDCSGRLAVAITCKLNGGCS